MLGKPAVHMLCILPCKAVVYSVCLKEFTKYLVGDDKTQHTEKWLGKKLFSPRAPQAAPKGRYSAASLQVTTWKNKQIKRYSESRAKTGLRCLQVVLWGLCRHKVWGQKSLFRLGLLGSEVSCRLRFRAPALFVCGLWAETREVMTVNLLRG